MLKGIFFGFIIILFFFPALPSKFIIAGNSDVLTIEELTKKAKRLHVLIEEKASKGLNITEALVLDQMSKEAAESGDIAHASQLLDDAINYLISLPDKEKPKKGFVEFSVNTKSVKVTEGVPKYEHGKEVTDLKSAFNTRTVNVRDGVVKLEVNSTPFFVEEYDITPPVRVQSENSPFGFHPANTYSRPVDRNLNRLAPPSKIGFVYNNAIDLGVRWTRPEFYAIWSFIQKDREDIIKGIFNWNEHDYVYGTVPKDICIIGNIAVDTVGINGFEGRMVRGQNPYPRTFTFKSRELEEKYICFVKKLVERYDGDGIDDMPGLQNPIKHWQVENEPDLNTKDWAGYAHLLEITYKAIKASSPECKVLIGGMAFLNGFRKFYLPILNKLNGKYIDIFDFHLYGPSLAWTICKDYVNTIKKGLSENGYNKVEIWITETGTYTGKPAVPTPSQTEKDQASSLVKRYVYALSLGVNKIFWAFGLIEGFTDSGNTEFDHTGLIYRKNSAKDKEVKKLAYYSYKLLTEKLEGCDFSKVESLNLGERIFAYKFNKLGKAIYVFWAE